MFGKLTWSAIPFHEPIIMVTSAVVALAITAVLAWVIVKGHLPYIWKEWLSSVDHKRIGVMYIVLALVMLLRGFADAILMRSQQAVALGSAGFLPPEHYNQIFSAHGTIMIFFVAMPFVIGLMNFAVPLQLGARDVAFPVLNSVSFWLTATGALLVNISLFIGEFARVGWLPYPPLAGLEYSPGVGVDYYLWALQISGVGTLLTGVNFVTTVLKVRAPGMTYLHMPIFCWTTLASNLLIVAAFPILTVTLALLLLDRYLGFHFFTNEAGGNPMMFMNLIWAWGHPEVYILVLPAFGIFSEVFATFSGKPLFGYRSMVAATMGICILSFMVWLHHFFTMGAGANVNAIFGIATMIIAVPTGVKIYNWLFTMYGGRVVFEPPMLWALGFVVTFIIGGITGVLLAVPPADFVLHNSLFLVAHFHNVIIGGVVFGLVRRLRVLVSQGLRLPPAPGPGQGGVLVLDHRLLRRLHAALRARPDGHDTAHAALRRARVAAVARGRRRGRPDHRRRRRDPGGATRLEHPPSRSAARRHRRPVERAHARVDDALAAADVQLRGDAGNRGRGGVLDAQAECDRAPGATTRARISRHSHAAQQLRRLHLRLLLGHHGLRADLAHLVARRRGLRGCLGRVRRRRLARRT